MQVSNATAVYVRRPGNAKKFKAEVVCDGKMADLALLTVKEDVFWTGLRGLEFVDVPDLQSPIAGGVASAVLLALKACSLYSQSTACCRGMASACKQGLSEA